MTFEQFLAERKTAEEKEDKEKLLLLQRTSLRKIYLLN